MPNGRISDLIGNRAIQPEVPQALLCLPLTATGANDYLIGRMLGHSARTMAGRSYIQDDIELFRSFIDRIELDAKPRLIAKDCLKVLL